MMTGKLTPRTNNKIKEARFTGGFGQPNGFASVLTVGVCESGDAALTLNYNAFDHEQMWSVMLTNEQRKTLGSLLLSYEPVLWEEL